ncbi:nuclear transport factor 2 family protein [Sinisalibacter aestuarii]|uniref:SnoaL-like domain-containing protein n=1 Tax=Sinisalibacter aestuarii TaxID=2949426 RepID=A0ABQ5LQV2_9RHOB|nr:nuclear transport factor 2 family protein [Sinisalibacter aestuarii]GKY87389.1 hypothetical protein STA1M1_12580 [Sinisalibacter aestuarii]
MDIATIFTKQSVRPETKAGVVVHALACAAALTAFTASVASAQDGTDRIHSIVEIQNLFGHYANALDSGRISEAASLWTEDGGAAVYYRTEDGTGLVLTDQPHPQGKADGCVFMGRENLVSYWGAFGLGGDLPRAKGLEYDGNNFRHQISSIWVKEVVGDTAKASAFWGGQERRGIYEWFLKRVEGEWKIHWSTYVLDGPRDYPCTLVNPDFPLPEDGSFGVTPSLANPSF